MVSITSASRFPTRRFDLPRPLRALLPSAAVWRASAGVLVESRIEPLQGDDDELLGEAAERGAAEPTVGTREELAGKGRENLPLGRHRAATRMPAASVQGPSSTTSTRSPAFS